MRGDRMVGRRRFRFGFFVLACGFLLFVGSANAELLSAELRVNGLSCPFCAFGIEKKLLDVDGVRDVEVFLDEGRITLEFDEDSRATVEDLERAVEKAGFELAGLRLSVRGRVLETAAGRLVVHSAMTLRLAEAKGDSSVPISIEALERLRADQPSEGDSRRLEGRVEEPDTFEPVLILDGVRSTGSERGE